MKIDFINWVKNLFRKKKSISGFFMTDDFILQYMGEKELKKIKNDNDNYYHIGNKNIQKKGAIIK